MAYRFSFPAGSDTNSMLSPPLQHNIGLSLLPEPVAAVAVVAALDRTGDSDSQTGSAPVAGPVAAEPPGPCLVHPDTHRRFWRSAAGVVTCGQCHPSALSTLVTAWIEAGADTSPHGQTCDCRACIPSDAGMEWPWKRLVEVPATSFLRQAPSPAPGPPPAVSAAGPEGNGTASTCPRYPDLHRLFWLSTNGQVRCKRCYPPQYEALVKETIDLSGPADPEATP
jgi:hypothetical protein